MNFKSRIVMGCLLGVCVLQVSAEKTYKYRISLRDKAETAYSVGSPQAYLSERALERRERQGLKGMRQICRCAVLMLMLSWVRVPL